MKISIHNFKTIKELVGFEIKPITVISGVNSSGKTSIIQLLLILKQTLERSSAKNPFVMDGSYVQSRSFKDLVFKKNTDNFNIQFSIIFDKEELDTIEKDRISIFDHINQIECEIKAELFLSNENLLVHEFEIKYIAPGFTKEEQWIRFQYVEQETEDIEYLVTANSGIFGLDFFRPQAKDNKNIYIKMLHEIFNKRKEGYPVAELDKLFVEWETNRPLIRGLVGFNMFFPSIVEETVPNKDFPEISENPLTKKIYEPKIKGIQKLIENVFAKISYIGPLREEPKDNYGDTNNASIGNKGQYTAAILTKEASMSIDYYSISFSTENIVKYQKNTSSLKDAVKYWICDVFKLANNIKAEKNNDNYIVTVIDSHDIAVSIKHVGFGISQILPIVVEGLRMPSDGILILEQPEIHLHPKIQSLLFDFLYSLTLAGKRIIVETHSDHLITRMKRRVVEDMNELQEKINLTFIEESKNGNIFRRLQLSDMGTLDYWPPDFIDVIDSDYKAIIKAQAKKRTTKNDNK